MKFPRLPEEVDLRFKVLASEREKIILLRKSGASVLEIMKQYGLKKSAVYRILDYRKSLADERARHKNNPSKPTKEQYEKYRNRKRKYNGVAMAEYFKEATKKNHKFYKNKRGNTETGLCVYSVQTQLAEFNGED